MSNHHDTQAAEAETPATAPLSFTLTFSGVVNPTGATSNDADEPMTPAELEENLRGMVEAAIGQGQITHFSAGTLEAHQCEARVEERDTGRHSGHWPDAFREVAQAEGWDIFETDGCESEPWRNDVLLINREDEADLFESDQAALEHVIEKATAGSQVHRRALELHMTPRSRGNAPLAQEAGTALDTTRDHTLPRGEHCWITVSNRSVLVNAADDGVVVDVFAAGQEAGEAIASTYAFYNEQADDDASQ